MMNANFFLRGFAFGVCCLLLAACPNSVGDGNGDGTGDGNGNGTGTGGGNLTVPPENAGYTVFEASPDTQKIYVSSSEGDDNNIGLIDSPVRTLARGMQLMRDGFPDWLLLKRGDSWEETFGNWTLNGRSPEEPALVSTYGEGPRPLILTGSENGIRQIASPSRGEEPLEDVAFVGLHFLAHTYTGEDNPTAVDIQGVSNNLLFEDLYLEGYNTNFLINAIRGPVTDTRIRHCIIVDAYSTDVHSQGIYMSKAEGVLIENCVFDHNGWRESVPGADPTIFNHNIYMQSSTSGLVFRNNISMRASSHGIQARSGGDIYGNVFIQNPLGILYGGLNDGAPPGVTGLCADNVVLQSRDIDEDTNRGNGIAVVAPNPGSVIQGNVIANEASESRGTGIVLNSFEGSGIHDITIANNIVYNHGGPLRFGGDNASGNVVRDNVFQVVDGESTIINFQQAEITASLSTFENNLYFSNHPETDRYFRAVIPTDDGASRLNLDFEGWKLTSNESGAQFTEVSFQDPTRSVESYQESIGEEPTFEAFIEGVRSQSAANYREEYSVDAIREYFREGFKHLFVSKLQGGGLAQVGDPHYMYVVAEGKGDLTYQWRRNGQDIPGATSATNSIPVLDYDHSGNYSVIVQDIKTSLHAGPVKLKVVEHLSAGGPIAIVLLAGTFLVKGIAAIR